MLRNENIKVDFDFDDITTRNLIRDCKYDSTEKDIDRVYSSDSYETNWLVQAA